MNSYTKLMFISNFGDTQDPILMFLLFDCYGVTCEFKIYRKIHEKFCTKTCQIPWKGDTYF